MNLEKGLEVLQIILDNQNNQEFKHIYPVGNPIFDAIAIKPLKKRHIVPENIDDKGTRDADIRIEGKMRTLFPYVENFRYEDEEDNTGHYKRWFLTQFPVAFSMDNLNHLHKKKPTDHQEEGFFFTHENYREDSFIKVHLSKEKREGERLSIGYKDIDDPAFYEFRKLLFEDDYLIICKLFQQPKYIFLGAKEEDFTGVNMDYQKPLVFLYENDKRKHYTVFSVENLKEFAIPSYKESSEEDTKQSSETQDDQGKNVTAEEVPHPKQWLLSGAPGTGKSYKLKSESEKYFKKENIHRVTFHSSYSYGQFIGAFKPKHSAEGKVSYGYQLGTLMKVLIKALENPQENYVLIAEELNRGNANEIFGDFLQLLDRDGSGKSVYPIDANEDLAYYLEQNHPGLPERLILPNNLYIWGTMNHSDQHTFPIDSAFFRRWEHDHIGVNENEEAVSTFKVELPNNEPIHWNTLRKQINNELSKLPFVKEDQLIGPFFIKKEYITEDEFFSQVVLYLKENVLKDFATQLLRSNRTSELKRLYREEGGEVFHFKIA